MIRISEKHGVNPILGQCRLCCGDTGTLALLGRLPQDAEAPHKGVVPGEPPCSKCREMMAQGYLLIVCRDNTDSENPYRTGQQFVLKSEAAQRLGFEMEHGACFIEETVARNMGLYDIKPGHEA